MRGVSDSVVLLPTLPDCDTRGRHLVLTINRVTGLHVTLSDTNYDNIFDFNLVVIRVCKIKLPGAPL